METKNQSFDKILESMEEIIRESMKELQSSMNESFKQVMKTIDDLRLSSGKIMEMISEMKTLGSQSEEIKTATNGSQGNGDAHKVFDERSTRGAVNRKATKLYCFVHKVPVCGECICFPEHQICVVHTYSEWVIDGEYDWPPNCCQCQVVLEEGTDSQTTRLGCLHVIHTNCLASHIKGFPPHTAPAGYVCPACSTSIWPPKIVKDLGSRLHSKLKEAILQTGMEKNLFGNHPVSSPATDSRSPPPAFASEPLMHVSGYGGGEYNESVASLVAKDSDGYPVTTGSTKPSSTDIEKPGATTRKSALQVERQNSEISYYADNEDANRKKYTRRGTLRNKFLRSLLPFWSSALPTLPVTAPTRKDAAHTDDTPEGRTRHHRSSRMDPRKILLVIAIMACMATMGILYYRIAQRGFDEEFPEDAQQQLQ